MSAAPPAADASRGTPAAPGAAIASLGLLSLLVFAAVAVATQHRTPGPAGLIAGVFSGGVTAALFFFASRWGVRWLAAPTGSADLAGPADGLDDVLGPTLRELEVTRIDTADKINRRMRRYLPLGLALGVGAWCLMQFKDKPSGLIELGFMTLAGGGFGYTFAAGQLSEAYRQAYKARVLPLLASRFGQLQYRPGAPPDCRQLAQEEVLPGFDDVDPDDEIFGDYRGLAVSITELKLTEGSGKEQRTTFDGLLARVQLPRNLAGTTAIVGDNGVIGALEDRFRKKGRQRVRLESPAFEKIFDVYASDQIAARALLTPAFMERMMTLGERAGFMNPTALAVDNHLTIALPKSGSQNLFEPPSWSQPAASRDALVRLSGDLTAVFRAMDAVIDLDQAARSQALDQPA